MGKDKSKAGGDIPADAPSDNPFAALAGLRDALPPGQSPAAPAAVEEVASAAPRRAVIRYERKGRGGKEATVVEQLGLPPAELERWLKDLKKQLGCGGVVEGDALVLQGDQRGRLKAALTARGVKKVSGG